MPIKCINDALFIYQIDLIFLNGIKKVILKMLFL